MLTQNLFAQSSKLWAERAKPSPRAPTQPEGLRSFSLVLQLQAKRRIPQFPDLTKYRLSSFLVKEEIHMLNPLYPPEFTHEDIVLILIFEVHIERKIERIVRSR